MANCLSERFDRFGDAGDRAEAGRRYRRLATDPGRGPEQALRDARNWGGWAADHGDWAVAVEAFEMATARAEALHRVQQHEVGVAEWLGTPTGCRTGPRSRTTASGGPTPP